MFNVCYLDEATLGDSPKRVHEDLVVLLERLRAIGFEVNGSKCELTILNARMLEATEALFRGHLPGTRVVEPLKRVKFRCWEPKWIKAFRELFMRRGKCLRELRQS